MNFALANRRGFNSEFSLNNNWNFMLKSSSSNMQIILNHRCVNLTCSHAFEIFANLSYTSKKKSMNPKNNLHHHSKKKITKTVRSIFFFGRKVVQHFPQIFGLCLRNIFEVCNSCQLIEVFLGTYTTL